MERDAFGRRGNFPAYLSDSVIGPCKEGHYWMHCRKPEEATPKGCPACKRANKKETVSTSHTNTLDVRV